MIHPEVSRLRQQENASLRPARSISIHFAALREELLLHAQPLRSKKLKTQEIVELELSIAVF